MMILAVLICIVVGLYVLYAKKQHTRFSEIPGPSPRLIFGNLSREFVKYPEVQQKWVQQYGPIMKYFLGLHPVILVSSPEMLKTIMQTNASSFSNHPMPPISVNKKEEGLFSLKDSHWRKVRKTISPVFNSTHLKALIPLINERTDALLGVLARKRSNANGFDIHSMLQKLTMDVIGTSAFGVKFDCLGTESNELTRAAVDIFNNINLGGASIIGYFLPPIVVPFVGDLMRAVPVGGFKKLMQGFDVCAKQVLNIVNQRRNAPNKDEADFVDLLLNAENDGNMLSDVEIRDNCVTFLLAGHETSANTLAFFVYQVAQYKDIEDKLVNEIVSVFGKDGRPESYEQIQSCQYMDMVLNESQRLIPTAPLTNREATEDVTIGGYNIPKGTEIHIPIYAIHRDPANWPDPEHFDPERFRDFEVNSQHKVTFLPFGYGPRTCIGLRFAQLEMKMIIARLYQKYTFKLIPGQVPLQTTAGATVSPTSGIFVTVEPRLY